MLENKNIRYIDRPDVREFPNDDVAKLTNILNKVDSTNSWARHELARTLKDTPDAARIAEIDPAFWPIEQMCAFRDQGNTIIAKDGDKIVGMIGFEELPKTPHGQSLFEMRRTTVLPEYRRQGIGRVLRESMMKRLRDMDPDAMLLSRIHKENDANLHLAASTQFVLITNEDAEKLGIPKEWIAMNADAGYQFYVFDPRKNS